MSVPTPENPGSAWICWVNFVVANCAMAALGIIPEHTLAYGVEVDGSDISLIFQLSEFSTSAQEDMEDIISELEGLLGPTVDISYSYELRSHSSLTPHNSAFWIYVYRD